MKKKIALVTGSAGFIGSNLVDKLLEKKYFVIGIDNFRTGKKQFFKNHSENKNFCFKKLDLSEKKNYSKISEKKIDIIFHMAANADVRKGYINPLNDLKYNTIMTSNILEYARKKKIKNFIFCSTGSIYGETKKIPTPENDNFPIQTSMYGASKLACEGLIQAYSEAYQINSYIFRFVSILGQRYTHGHIIDFFKKLKKNKKKLKILGNGQQKKSYLHVDDCISAILHIIQKNNSRKINIFNLGTNETITVKQSAKIICKHLKLKPKLIFAGGKRGWIGDVPLIKLSIKKIKETGWKPKNTIKKSIIDTLKYLEKNK